MTPGAIAARAAPNAPPEMRAPSIGVALSGGGYRAMLYHLGALRRLNEAGLLSVVERFSMVSGGAFVGAVLASHWTELRVGADGVAGQFERVERDVFAIAARTIDISAAIKGRLPGSTPASIVARELRRSLADVSLAALPTTPRFTFNATNMDTGTLFRWAPEYAADHAIGMIERPDVSVAEVVAASAAFPPWLSPQRLATPGTWVDPDTRNPIPHAPRRITLTDGGVYDNLGLESLKGFHTVLASDGGAALPRAPRMRADPLSQAIRAAFIGNENQRRQRRHDLVDDFVAQRRLGSLWTINTLPTAYTVSTGLECPPQAVERLARVKTRLRAMSDIQQRHLANWGYLSADLALRTYVDSTIPAATAYPWGGGLG